MTKRKALVEFTMPEFSDKRQITSLVHVDERTSSDKSSYDMIIGMDLMTELGLVIDMAEKVVKWGELEVELKPLGTLSTANNLEQLYHMDVAPGAIKEAEERQRKILDADYSKTDMNEYVQSLKHLTDKEKEMLLDTLKRHPKLFAWWIGYT